MTCTSKDIHQRQIDSHLCIWTLIAQLHTRTSLLPVWPVVALDKEVLKDNQENTIKPRPILVSTQLCHTYALFNALKTPLLVSLTDTEHFRHSIRWVTPTSERAVITNRQSVTLIGKAFIPIIHSFFWIVNTNRIISAINSFNLKHQFQAIKVISLSKKLTDTSWHSGRTPVCIRGTGQINWWNLIWFIHKLSRIKHKTAKRFPIFLFCDLYWSYPSGHWYWATAWYTGSSTLGSQILTPAVVLTLKVGAGEHLTAKIKTVSSHSCQNDMKLTNADPLQVKLVVPMPIMADSIVGCVECVLENIPFWTGVCNIIPLK